MDNASAHSVVNGAHVTANRFRGWGMVALTTLGRRVVGPAARRLRRQLQWRGCGGRLVLKSAPSEDYDHLVATHASPLIRPLAGLEPALQRNKVVNLRIAVARLDSLVLDPGQRLSFWYHVRRPSRRRGFLDGLVLDHGRLTAGVGGGLCQLTNLIYWMTLHTPLTVVERWRHSYDVFPDADRTQPFGTGATCAWPVLDLQIENRTQSGFRLGLEVTDSQLTGRWSSAVPVLARYQVYEARHAMTNDAPGVFVRHNVIRRREFNVAGVEVADELVAENHALMRYQPFLAAGRDHG